MLAERARREGGRHPLLVPAPFKAFLSYHAIPTARHSCLTHTQFTHTGLLSYRHAFPDTHKTAGWHSVGLGSATSRW